MSFQDEQLDLLMRVRALSAERAVAVYIVGGLLRDLLLQNPVCDVDLDFLVVGSASDFATALQESTGGELKLYPRFLTAKVLFDDQGSSIREIDFASARSEVYSNPGALPEVEAAELYQDLQRRDFSVNALAISVSDLCQVFGDHGQVSLSRIRERVIDRFNGLSDLDNRSIRVLHEKSFIDDPTRLFRACRYMVRLAGTLESATQTLFQAAMRAEVLDCISHYRVHMECIKAICEPKATSIFECFAERGLLDSIGYCSVELLEGLKRIDRISEHVNGEQAYSLRKKLGERLLYRYHRLFGEQQYFSDRNYSKKQAKSITHFFSGQTSPAALAYYLAGEKSWDSIESEVTELLREVL